MFSSVGNTIFPLLEGNEHLFVYGIDFSARAVAHLKEGVEARPEFHDRCKGFVCDIVKDELPEEIKNVDLITMVFVLSAIGPDKQLGAVQKLYNV